MDEKTAKTAGELLRRQALADAKTLGRGSIAQANAARIGAGLAPDTYRARRFPRSSLWPSPTADDLTNFVVALGLDVAGWCERAARYSPGRPLGDFMALAASVKDRRPGRRLPNWLLASRGRMRLTPVDLAENTIEALEAMRSDDPRSALKATRSALKEAAGPVGVGCLLAIHASNLREVDELADALLALRVAIPALDVGGDAWGMGRALTGAAGVAQACGDYALARGLIDLAEAFHIQAGSAVGRAVAMIGRASLMFNSGGAIDGVTAELSAAVGLLPDSAHRHIVPAYQIRAYALASVGDVDGAKEAADRAAEMALGGRTLRGRICWARAEIAAKRGQHGQAEALYTESLALIAEPLCDRLLLAAETIRAAVRQGETDRAIEVAKVTLGPMFRTLDDTEPTRRTLRAAHADLYRAAIEAGLTVAVVDRAIRRIEAVRTARRKRLLRTVSH